MSEQLTVKELQGKLADKFPYDNIMWRIQQSGITNNRPWALVIPYVDARGIQDRLDDLFGLDGWRDEYEQWNGGTVCKLSIKCGGEWITKWDGSPETDIEAFKGGFSKALVRAAVKFGMGRYLYDTPTTYAECITKKPDNKNDWFYAKFFKNKEDKKKNIFTAGWWKGPPESALKVKQAIQTETEPDTTPPPAEKKPEQPAHKNKTFPGQDGIPLAEKKQRPSLDSKPTMAWMHKYIGEIIMVIVDDDKKKAGEMLSGFGYSNREEIKSFEQAEKVINLLGTKWNPDYNFDKFIETGEIHLISDKGNDNLPF